MKRFLKIIGASEMAGGGLLILLVVTAPILDTTAPPWFFATALVVGAGSVTVGRWLWRGDPRGRIGSLPLQGMQIVRASTAAWVIDLIVGVQLDLAFSANRLAISAGAAGRLNVGPGNGGPSVLTINVFALVAFIALLLAGRRGQGGG